MEENDTIWVCLACGKTSEDRYGKKNISYGWDESCFINAVQVKKSHLVYDLNAIRVIKIKEGGIKMICLVCGKEILEDQPKIMEDEEYLHISCAIKLSDNVIIDSEYGDN